LRLGDILDSPPQGAHCVKSDELPELCAQAKPGSGDGTKARCLKRIDRDNISDSIQLCSYPYKAPQGTLAGAKVEKVDVLLLDHKVIEIRSTIAVPVNRLLAAYEAKYGEPASFDFEFYSNYASLNDFGKKVYDEMKGSVSAILSACCFNIKSVTWWTDSGKDMLLAMPPAERAHNNAKDTLPSANDDIVTARLKEQQQLLIGFGVAPAHTDNPWVFYYTDFQALSEASERNSKSIVRTLLCGNRPVVTEFVK
jgi:hypothetical protein